MLELIRPKATDRKLRFFACACCRMIWHLLNDESQNVVLIAERFADGLADEGERRIAEAVAWRVRSEAKAARQNSGYLIAESPGFAASVARCSVTISEEWEDTLNVLLGACSLISRYRETRLGGVAAWHKSCCELIRDVWGNPFRPVTIESSLLAWNDRTIPKIARCIYDERRFEDMPLLADALEESGCTNEEILGHCRGHRPHTKGCFVIDALLGKEPSIATDK